MYSTLLRTGPGGPLELDAEFEWQEQQWANISSASWMDHRSAPSGCMVNRLQLAL